MSITLTQYKKLSKKAPPVKKIDPDRYAAFKKLLEQELNVEVKKEFYFAKPRLWRFDFCIPEHMIAIEIDGGTYSTSYYTDKEGNVKEFKGGRHNAGKGFIEDMEKLNAATVLGWKVLRFTSGQLYTNKTLETIKKLIKL